ncbi:MAG: KH domain-containing protein [Candidatus Aenigmatarchaeota archaeon]
MTITNKLKIPEARIAVLIGHGGETKKLIQKKLRVSLNISGCDVDVTGEPVDVMDAENIVKAIGRGFDPGKALKLSDEEYTLCIIPLPKKEREQTRIKSRIIGEKGSARENIERLTQTNICVYGKTISIIGKYEDVDDAREAVLNLMKGFRHASVYALLEKKLREKRLTAEE